MRMRMSLQRGGSISSFLRNGFILQSGRLSPPGCVSGLNGGASTSWNHVSNRFAGILAVCTQFPSTSPPSSPTPSPVKDSFLLPLNRTHYDPRLLISRNLATQANLPEHVKVRLPALSPTMEMGSILAWQKKEGEELGEGDLLCEIETDKATMQFETPEEGFLAKIVVPAGEKDVPLGKIVCIIVSNLDDVAAFKDYVPSEADSVSIGGASPPTPPAPTPAAPPPPRPTPTAASPTPPVAPPTPKPQVAMASPSGRIIATPFAKKIAAEKGIDLASLQGSGPGGRILASDVESAPVGGPAAIERMPQPEFVPGSQYTDIPLTNMRKVIAKRLLESKTTIPHYYLNVDIVLDDCLRIREKLNGVVEKEGAKISVNDFVVKAAALSCLRVPEANSMWMEAFVRHNHSVDVSVAVATDAGLITPIIRGAHRKGLKEISMESKELAMRAREGKLQPEEFQGGTFTVSNLGMLGVKNFTAIINPPQSCILAVGAANKRILPDPDVGHREATVMSVTLSCDHRVVDGAVGAQWLQHLKRFLEKPHTMLL